MGKIQVLDKSVSNKIAAGEVVERPASVVKELLENALDAGATHIVTEIKNGGVAYIRVADDGCGIPREEVPVALLRHATSKIASEHDLEAITTLGFRGEALSSIAAVSRLEIYTRTTGEETGTHLAAVDGEVTECSEAGCPTGTTVIVRELFSTTPARMKFLKKNYTEAGYVADLVNRLALAHPEVSFRLISDGKELLFTNGSGDLLQVIFAVYGKDLKNTMLPAAYQEGAVSVSGFCATAAGARPNRSMQSFFVNGRYIKSPLLARAVEEAYKNELMSGKFPACVLLVALPPTMVDINVHPTKLEAKFADEKSVYHAVYWAAKNALYQKKEVPAVTLRAEETEEGAQGLQPSAKPVGKSGELHFGAGGIRSGTVLREPAVKMPTPFVWQGLAEKMQETVQERLETLKQGMPEQIHKEALEAKAPQRNDISAKESEPEAILLVSETKEPMQKEETVMQPLPEPMPDIKPYRICGQIFNTYIIVEQEGEMLMVDQHAAHERLRYEALLKNYADKQSMCQLLLTPVTVRLTAVEEAVFEENQEELLRLGFDAELFGDKTVILRGVPEEMDEGALQAAFIEVLGHLGDARKDARTAAAQRALYTIACKSAVKAGNRLTERECEALLDAVFRLPAVNTCPHGRPITIALTKGFIEKQFKRIV
ncbi:MAG: DNA mismatch repair endonuclease MutL [Ruminococcaceae bacterium]|nr:DNA mismatch repair endonuclease MutL [Oscillospiraceae bacterium]